MVSMKKTDVIVPEEDKLSCQRPYRIRVAKSQYIDIFEGTLEGSFMKISIC